MPKTPFNRVGATFFIGITMDKKITRWLKTTTARLLAVGVGSILSIESSAQSARSYVFSAAASTFDSLVGATMIPSLQGDDVLSGTVPIGFTFTYAGVSYTSVQASSNGWLGFTATTPTATQSRANSAANMAHIGPGLFPLWDDLYGSTAGSASYLTAGAAGSRIFTFEWKRWVWWYSSTSLPTISFQVKLYEATNNIEFIYKQESAPLPGSESATIGIGTGSSDYLVLNGTGTTPTASGTVFTTSLSTKPATGQRYTFSPPPPCTGAPVAGTVSPASQNVCSRSTPATCTASGYTQNNSGIVLQWQESDDNGVNDPWNDAVGGSGSGTGSYTPPMLAGARIYYRLRVTCTPSGMSATGPVSVVNGPASPAIAASGLSFSNITNSGMTISWTNGNGNRRYVVVNNANTFSNPVNGTTAPVVAGTTYAGSGEQIVYDGTASTVTIRGLSCNTTYYAQVYEYLRCGTTAAYTYYFNTSSSATNPNSATTVQPISVPFPVSNSFAGYNGTNLSTVSPGWYEASIITAAGTTPAQVNPTTGSSSWTDAAVFPTTTARVNLYTNTRNDWIISPRISLAGTTNPRLRFGAAITGYDVPSPSATGMQGTDDKVTVLISTSGCGNTWTPLYTFSAANTTALTNILTDFSIPLNYVGQTIQVAFQATDGPVSDTSDYDFHIGNIVIEETPSCIAPTQRSISNLTATGAVAGWTSSASLWQVEYGTGALGTGTRSIVSANTFSMSGLTPNTTYNFFVRSICTVGDTSAWARPYPFTTLCGSMTLPFAENFNNYLPNICWTTAVGALNVNSSLVYGTSTWMGLDYMNGGTDNAASTALYGTDIADWLITQSIDLGASGSQVLEFNFGITEFGLTTTDALGSDDSVAVVISTDNGMTWSTNHILTAFTAANTPVSASGSKRYFIPMNGYTGQVKIGFYASSGTMYDTEDNNIFIDSLKISDCVRPMPVLGNDTTICSGEAISLNAGTATGYLWSNSATTQSVTINTAGTYWVKAFNGSEGCFSTDTIVISVNPRASVSTITPVVTGTSVAFSSDAMNASTYAWSFGDNSTSASPTPTHVYAASGVYTVRLIVTNNCGADTAYTTVNIGGVNVLPVTPAQISIHPNPANNDVVIECKGGKMESYYIISNIGTLVKEGHQLHRETETIPIKTLAAGIYLLKVKTSKGIVISRLEILH